MGARDANILRRRRHRRLRKRLAGTSERPRMCVYRSLQHIYAQVVDDESGRTLASASTLDKGLRDGYGGNVAAAQAVGSLLATRLKEKGIATVVFDRGGYRYAGRVKALAEAVREGGLAF
jgi:large subunit ribosomal protein L18